MLGTIIYIVIIFLIVHKVLKDKKNRKKKAANAARNTYSQGNSRQTYQPQAQRRTNTQQTRQSQAQNRTSAQQAYQSQAQNDYQAKQQAMKDLKYRLEQKYKNQPPSMNKKQRNAYKQEKSILQQAKQNVAEYDGDVMKQTDKKWHEKASEQNFSTSWEETDMLSRVYDLMVTGYSGNLNFQRDFLAEGMDMINRIGMIDDNMGSIEYNSELMI